MNAGDLAQWAVAAFLIVGLALTWRKNGKSQERRDGAHEQSIKDIKAELSHPDHGLSALKDSISDVKTNCAGVTAGFTERLSNHDREIKEIKNGRRKKQ